MQDMEDALAAKSQAVEELSRELEEIRAAFCVLGYSVCWEAYYKAEALTLDSGGHTVGLF